VIFPLNDPLLMPLADFHCRTAASGLNLKAGVSYDFNVVVQDNIGQYALYEFGQATALPKTDATGGGGGIPLGILLGAGIPVFIVTIVVIVYLVIRNRKLTKELEIEMHDVPKAVVRKAVRGQLDEGQVTSEKAPKPNKQDKKYSRLITEEDDETDYAPPDFSNEL